MKYQFLFFLLRWVLNSFGLWVAARILSGVHYDTVDALSVFLLAGLILSICNAILRPILLILALPAIVLSLGLFMLVVNGFLVWLVSVIVPGLEMTFWSAILASIIVSILNFVFTMLIERDEGDKKHAR